MEETGRQQAEPGAVAIETIRRNRIHGGGGIPAPAVVDAGQDHTIEGLSGSVPVRLFVPDEWQAVYLHFHHGGWVFGSIWEQDERLWAVATRSRVAVVTVGYRLAPEYPLPAAIDDGEAVALGLIEGGLDGRVAERVLIGGESAGAHVALATALRLRDRGVIGHVSALQLSYGMYDLSMTASQRQWGDRFIGLSTPWLEWFYDQAAPGLTGPERARPNLSPLNANLLGLPPALLTVGTADPLVDDSTLLAAALSAADGKVELACYPDGPHGINVLPTQLGCFANQRIEAFIAAYAKPTAASLGCRIR